MASSDDEGEALPRDVDNYDFVVGKDEPISFADLPVQWKKGEIADEKKKQIFLRGTTDNRLQKIYKQVIAWKFDLSCAKPEVSVLSKENQWIRLLNPRKAFEDIIRTILITVYCLHFLKRKPDASHKALWDHLCKVFSSLEPKPSVNDLVDHTSLIDEAVKGDETLAKSKLLITFLEEKPWKRAFIEVGGTTPKSTFIDDDNDTLGEKKDDESDDEDDCFDSVCAICDNGGKILCCEGKCMRSFHPTVDDGADSSCSSLGYTAAQLEGLEKIVFYCKNCEYKQHQCFACGELGSSDESSSPEVFRCVNGACGHFYHPGCVAILLHDGNKAAAEELQKNIAAGEQFACPLHRCYVCKELEVKSVPDLQFAICRRCPRAYHRKCLPSEIPVIEDEDMDMDTVRRAWKGLIPNRILIYCLKHEIDEDLLTPARNHIKFPGFEQKKRQPLESSGKQKLVSKEKTFALEDFAGKKSAAKSSKGVETSSAVKQNNLSKRRGDKLFGQGSSKRQKMALNSNRLRRPNESCVTEGKISLGEKLFVAYGMDSEPFQSSRVERVGGEREPAQKVKSSSKGADNLLTLDTDSKERILTIMKYASRSITLEEIVEKHKAPSTHAQSSKSTIDKNVTLGKVEGSVEALRAALQKLEGGGTVKDAKAVCGTDLLTQVVKWKNKLKVYLAPFLYGMRYTSFGRHFTKVDKLKAIVDILHWYVKDGDTIVDFCCGSNDFSWLMNKKLDEMGKSCSYKNYDIVQAKNDFNFEKRDWMTVQPKELPLGSKLIMGLNPPFGVNAGLANKFISKALEFKPKLLILIVPPETQRLDERDFPYDLLWEDDQMLGGKSFYLPGSVDVNDKQMEDWNVNTPPLYLWSHRDWTPKHKAIAQQHGHLSKDQKKSLMEENRDKRDLSDTPGEQNNFDQFFMHCSDDHNLESGQETLEQEATNHKEELPRDSSGLEADRNQAYRKNQPKANSSEFHGKRKTRGRTMSLEGNSPGKRLYHNMDGSRLLDDHSPKSFEIHPQMDVDMEENQHSERSSFSGSHSYSQREHGENGNNDLVRNYRLKSEESYPSLTNRQLHTVNPEYGFRASDDPLMGYRGESTDILANRSYTNESNNKYGRDVNIQSHVHVQGRPGLDSWHQKTEYISNPGSGYPSPYGQLGPASNSIYDGTNNSAMQRYAPRLDELNPTRMNQMGSGLSLSGTSGVFHPVTRSGYQAGSLSFAPGPRRSYSPRNSSGWLNE